MQDQPRAALRVLSLLTVWSLSVGLHPTVAEMEPSDKQDQPRTLRVLSLLTVGSPSVHPALRVLSLLTVWSLSVHPAAAAMVPEAMDLPDHLAMFCLDIDVCPERNFTKEWNETASRSFRANSHKACCTECSCDEACVETNNCCFPRTDLHPGSTCLYPTTESSAEGNALPYKSYRMIDSDASTNFLGNVPETSCLQNAEKIPCGEVSYPMFGNMLPVYSKQLNKIYKNPACAASHGVNDLVMWNPRLFCRHPQTRIHMLDYGIIPYGCFVHFIYPGKESDLDLHVCSRDMKHKCDRDLFPIPERLNITANQVRALCESGFVSPGQSHDGLAYANVFCYLCNNKNPSIYKTSSRVCTAAQGYRTEFSNGLSYIISINRVSKGDANPNANKPTIPKVCYNKQGILNSSRCRDLKCPTYQVRDQNGKCALMVYDDKDTNNYKIALRVHVDGFKISSNDDFKEQMEELVKLWKRVNPWPTQWTVYCELNPENSSFPQVKSLFVQMIVSPAGNMNSQTFLRTVKIYLNKSWVIEANGSYINVHQSLAEFAEVSSTQVTDVAEYGYPKFVPTYYNKMDPADLLGFNITEPLLLQLRRGNVGPYTVLNKLYYCDQVELRSQELILYKIEHLRSMIRAQALFSRLTGRLMFENEFLLVEKPDGEIVARICLSDSGFKKEVPVTSGAGASAHVPGPGADARLALVLTLAWPWC